MFGWGGSLISPIAQDVLDYWSGEEQSWDISTKEAVAVERVLLAFQDHLRNTWVDVSVDNQAVIYSWNNQGGRSRSLNDATKRLFFTTTALNISLHMSYIPRYVNPADIRHAICLQWTASYALSCGKLFNANLEAQMVIPVILWHST